MRIVFMGTPAFAVPALEALLESSEHTVCLVVTQPDKPAGRKRRLTPPPVKEVAERHGIPLVQPTSARTPEFLARIASKKADVAVVVAYGKLLPNPVLEAFPHGCINIHGSLLPRYRGAAPIQWAVLNGDAETGVSIMRLDAGMDTGPVLLCKRVPIGEEDTAGMLFERLAPLGASALLEALNGLQEGILSATRQSEEGASHAPMLSKEDGRVDWTQGAERVAARIRALDPWPGSFTDYEGGRLKFFGARARAGHGAPGALLSYSEEGMVVACATGAVSIREVQAPGKKRMPAVVFARGRRLEPGLLFSEPEPA